MNRNLLPSLLPKSNHGIDTVHRCDALSSAGVVCGREFTTAGALHRHLSAKGGHAMEKITATVVSNLCPCCQTYFASRDVTRHHVANSSKQGFCRLNLATSVIVAEIPTLPIVCCLCEEEFLEGTAYCSHVSPQFPHMVTLSVAPPLPGSVSYGRRLGSSRGCSSRLRSRRGRGQPSRVEETRTGPSRCSHPTRSRQARQSSRRRVQEGAVNSHPPRQVGSPECPASKIAQGLHGGVSVGASGPRIGEGHEKLDIGVLQQEQELQGGCAATISYLGSAHPCLERLPSLAVE